MECPLGLPFHFTHPRNHRVNPSDLPWELAQGIPQPAAVRDDILVDIEPNTGKAISAALKIQLNLAVPAQVKGLTSNATDPSTDNTSKPRLYPIFWINKNSQLTNDQADALKAAQTAFSVTLPLLIVGSVCGPILFIIGLVLTRSARATKPDAVTSSV